ncbi:thiolase family protein [Leucobacter denitrificans]|uniref:Thiolase family protein n=1 Tax=Leucobacter denitrificans TaxID=683042 RepID=A0A7G9S306_9MICO|nr:thiolase family protein [Leucobacter denitrificans]QNN62231.1 thiolase family protein [Leucobacter denitrificans]
MVRKRSAAAIIGIGQTDWVTDWKRVRAGEKPADSVGYAAQAFQQALKDSGIPKGDIDGLIVGPTTAYERMGEVLGLNVRWGGQADAVQSVLQAHMAIEAGYAKVIALVYGNDQRSAGTQYGGPAAMGGGSFLSYVYHSPWGMTSQGALYALTARRYQEERGMTEADMGEVAVAQRAWASMNEAAIQRKTITVDDYIESRYVCEPLHVFDYCLVNDGGVALIIADAEYAKKMSPNPVSILGTGRSDLNTGATSLEPRLTDYYLPAQQQAGKDSYEIAGVGPEDMDGFLVYDSFSVHVPLALEGYGYTEVGTVKQFLTEQGIGPGGKLPVNTHGGHLSESYMQGWNHQLEAVRQVRQQAGARQIENAKTIHYTSDVAGKCMSIIYGR